MAQDRPLRRACTPPGPAANRSDHAPRPRRGGPGRPSLRRHPRPGARRRGRTARRQHPPLRRDDVGATGGDGAPGPGGPVRVRIRGSLGPSAPTTPPPRWSGPTGAAGATATSTTCRRPTPWPRWWRQGSRGWSCRSTTRLAPERRFPAPLDDDRPRSTAGWCTAGAGASRDRSRPRGARRPRPPAPTWRWPPRWPTPPPGRRRLALLLAYPVVDPSAARTRPSGTPTARLLWLDAEAIGGMFEALVGDVEHPPPGAVPLRSDPAGLPPTLITTAECARARCSAHRFAELARRAGVDVTVHDVEGCPRLPQHRG
ncbi:MAG: alpha/beta hydrolase fold domain-containing protein [Acidimicrobiales bacterium]|nr:alpha/beta hydrolase fold domain-containing protein [Acidimicrobiales bacterium]